MNLKHLNTSEMLTLENHAIDEYGASIDAMMQRAGKAIYDLMQNEILKKPSAHILVVTGKGNNGGDALVAARLLHESLIVVDILSPYPDEEFTEAAFQELQNCRDLGITVESEVEDFDLDSYDLIVDGLFGFSLKGDPRSPVDEIIKAINGTEVPILSADVPSGLDVHDGTLGEPTVSASYILAYGMPKLGLEGQKNLYLGDLGIPTKAYEDKGYTAPGFGGQSYIKLR